MSRTVNASRRGRSNSGVADAADAAAPHASAPHDVDVDVDDERRALRRERKALWFKAIKPPMYTVAITPVLVGSFAAYAETAVLSVPALLFILIAFVSIIAWTNLTNDVFDFDRGIDENKPESVVNLCGATRRARNVIFAVANGFLILSFALLRLLAGLKGSWDGTVLVVIGIAVMGGYAYQGPPFRLGYWGLGEPIAMFAWTFGVSAAYYSQICMHEQTARMIEREYPNLRHRVIFLLFHRLWDKRHYLGAASVLVAVPTTVILFCSHFHQYDDDKRAGKMSPIVRLGTKAASQVLGAVLVLFACAQVWMYSAGMIPEYPFYMSSVAVPYAIELENFVRRNHMMPSVVRVAKYYAVKFHFVHGIVLAVGFLLTAWRGGGMANV